MNGKKAISELVTELDEALTELAHLAFGSAVTWQRDQPTLAISAPLTAITASDSELY